MTVPVRHSVRYALRLGARIWVGAAVFLAVACGGRGEGPGDPDHGRSSIDGLPDRVIWAWDRPEDLRFLDPADAAVAVFESIVTVDSDRVEVRPRLHPLRVDPEVSLLGVVRIEVAEGTPLTESTLRQIAVSVLAHHRLEPTIGLQVDYDARRSERDAYRALLEDLRRRLPADHALSMTALASWCLGDAWLEGLPVDEVVPMLFSMGRAAEIVRATLDSGADFASPICRTAVGLATNEPWPRGSPGLGEDRRRYVFHPRSWDEAALVALRSAR